MSDVDRRFSNGTDWDNSIDFDDASDGSEGGYDRYGGYINAHGMMEIIKLRVKNAALRAELAAVSKERDIAWRDKLELMHERDALRALLREARSYVQGKYAADSELAFVIDAALNKGGMDE